MWFEKLLTNWLPTSTKMRVAAYIFLLAFTVHLNAVALAIEEPGSGNKRPYSSVDKGKMPYKEPPSKKLISGDPGSQSGSGSSSSIPPGDPSGKWLYDENKQFYLLNEDNQLVKHCSTRPSVVTGYPVLYDNLGYQYEINSDGRAVPQGTVRWIFVKDNTVEVDFQDGSIFDDFTRNVAPSRVSSWMYPSNRDRKGYYVFISVSLPGVMHAETWKLKQVKPLRPPTSPNSIPKFAKLRFQHRRFKAKDFKPFPLTDFCGSPSDIAKHISTNNIYVFVTGGAIYRSELKPESSPKLNQGLTSEVADSCSGC